MKHGVKHILILLLFLGLMRCAPIYVPAAHNIPMFSGKGEFQGSVGAGLGLNVQTANAFHDHLAFSANYLFAKREEQEHGRRHQAGEIALGYYANFNERWCFEVFAGYGMGKGNAYDSAYSLESPFLILPLFSSDRYEATGTFNKIYIQPSIGLKKNDFTWSISAKLSYVNATEINISRNDEYWWKGKTSKAFFSWVGDGQAPLLKKKIFLHYQVGLNVPFGDDPIFDYEPFMGSIGMLIKLNAKK